MEHITLAELNARIEGVLKHHMGASYWVIAEIGDLKTNQKGHCYLELVEKTEDRILAKMRGTIWAFTFRNLNVWFEKFTGKPLGPGMKILFNAVVQYHSVYGLSLNIRDIDAQYTLGERARSRMEVVERLKAEGVYGMNQELPLPLVPQHIAVISSASAAGWGDFENQLQKNAYGYDVRATLFQAVVQGDEAAGSITAAMHRVYAQSELFDILVIIRGGGASLDLDCFDSYQVTSHICQFPLPVITGIGHQRDQTVSDMVAHTSLNTPTGVADFVLSGIRTFDERLQYASERISELQRYFKEKQMHVLQLHIRRLAQAGSLALNRKQNSLNAIQYQVEQAGKMVSERQNLTLEALRDRLHNATVQCMVRASNALANYDKNLKHIDPGEVFRRGYTITLLNGKLLRDVEEPAVGSSMRTISAARDIESMIQSVKKK
jgi:exodeoxyribonuclease VII large subunit